MHDLVGRRRQVLIEDTWTWIYNFARCLADSYEKLKIANHVLTAAEAWASWGWLMELKPLEAEYQFCIDDLCSSHTLTHGPLLELAQAMVTAKTCRICFPGLYGGQGQLPLLVPMVGVALGRMAVQIGLIS